MNRRAFIAALPAVPLALKGGIDPGEITVRTTNSSVWVSKAIFAEDFSLNKDPDRVDICGIVWRDGARPGCVRYFSSPSMRRAEATPEKLREYGRQWLAEHCIQT